MKKIIVLCLCGFISACATGYKARYYFNEIQVVNQAGATIRDVSLRVLDSSKILSCTEVAKFAICDDRFGKRPYPQQGIDLSWTHPDGNRRSEVLNPGIPAFYFPTFPLRVVLEIREDGSVNPFFEQEEPVRDRGSLFEI